MSCNGILQPDIQRAFYPVHCSVDWQQNALLISLTQCVSSLTPTIVPHTLVYSISTPPPSTLSLLQTCMMSFNILEGKYFPYRNTKNFLQIASNWFHFISILRAQWSLTYLLIHRMSTLYRLSQCIYDELLIWHRISYSPEKAQNVTLVYDRFLKPISKIKRTRQNCNI